VLSNKITNKWYARDTPFFTSGGISVSNGGDRVITLVYMSILVNAIYPAKNISSFLAHILYCKIPTPRQRDPVDVISTNKKTAGGLLMPHSSLVSIRLTIAIRPITISMQPISVTPNLSTFDMSLRSLSYNRLAFKPCLNPQDTIK
jgi:hypothetical protein